MLSYLQFHNNIKRGTKHKPYSIAHMNFSGTTKNSEKEEKQKEIIYSNARK